MRYSQSEKMEIIKLVEKSDLGVVRTLKEIGINKSTFYKWYSLYQEFGYDGLAFRYVRPKQFWNEIPDEEKVRIVELALEYPEKSSREIAWHVTDTYGYYISESSVYRILKANDLIQTPDYEVLEAYDKFPRPTEHINELWQTDFTYFKIVHFGWYYLATVIDDYSRYVITWKLCKTMQTLEVKDVLDEAIKLTGVGHVNVVHKPRLLTDNGPCYVSGEMKDYMEKQGMIHTRGKPYHPMTQGKIERYHRSMKNVIKLVNYYTPTQLEDQMNLFVAYYNNYRYHESLENVTPADMYYGKQNKILKKRKAVKKKTMAERRYYFEKRIESNGVKL